MDPEDLHFSRQATLFFYILEMISCNYDEHDECQTVLQSSGNLVVCLDLEKAPFHLCFATGEKSKADGKVVLGIEFSPTYILTHPTSSLELWLKKTLQGSAAWLHRW